VGGSGVYCTVLYTCTSVAFQYGTWTACTSTKCLFGEHFSTGSGALLPFYSLFLLSTPISTPMCGKGTASMRKRSYEKTSNAGCGKVRPFFCGWGVLGRSLTSNQRSTDQDIFTSNTSNCKEVCLSMETRYGWVGKEAPFRPIPSAPFVIHTTSCNHTVPMTIFPCRVSPYVDLLVYPGDQVNGRHPLNTSSLPPN
jgi:hypothetical protein